MKNKLIILSILTLSIISIQGLAQHAHNHDHASHEQSSAVKVSNAGIPSKEIQNSLTPKQAIQKLKEGNKRFVEGKMIKRNYQMQVKESAKGQYPSAVILSWIHEHHQN